MRLVFLHGLESGPQGHKSTWLRSAGHDVVCPALPTRDSIAFLAQQRTRLPPEIAEVPVRVGAEALHAAQPEVLVGSSFGGGIAARLAADGAWAGPLVLLAPAAFRLFGVEALPSRPGRVVVVHGRRDELVPVDDSVHLAAASACEVLLWLVDDEHRLEAFVDAGELGAALEAAARSFRPAISG